jgi:FtsP/CotA-like multicopper oxidase with cupredoxin domain
VPNAASVPTSGSASGKKSSLKTSAAAVPYRKKSYHSIVVPMKLAVATLRIDRVSPLGYHDTYPVEPGGSITFRTRFADFAGKSLYHCHLVLHSDIGMMGVFEVVDS